MAPTKRSGTTKRARPTDKDSDIRDDIVVKHRRDVHYQNEGDDDIGENIVVKHRRDNSRIEYAHENADEFFIASNGKIMWRKRGIPKTKQPNECHPRELLDLPMELLIKIVREAVIPKTVCEFPEFGSRLVPGYVISKHVFGELCRPLTACKKLYILAKESFFREYEFDFRTYMLPTPRGQTLTLHEGDFLAAPITITEARKIHLLVQLGSMRSYNAAEEHIRAFHRGGELLSVELMWFSPMRDFMLRTAKPRLNKLLGGHSGVARLVLTHESHKCFGWTAQAGAVARRVVRQKMNERTERWTDKWLDYHVRGCSAWAGIR